MLSLSLDNITHGFGPRVILDAVSLSLKTDDRVGLVGANGSGKSTLLRILNGELSPESGCIQRAPGLTWGYLPQDASARAAWTIEAILDSASDCLLSQERRLRDLELALEGCDPEQRETTLLEYGATMEAFDKRDGYESMRRIEEIQRGLRIDGLALDRRLGDLSGGERTRVQLAALLVEKPDLLLLDEPTNNLDFGGARWLEQWLRSYDGAIIAASHDRSFLNSVVGRILEVDEYDHGLKDYIGNYDAYREARRLDRAQYERTFAAQQEEMSELREAMRTAARRVGHNRPPKDGDKSAYNGHGEFVQNAISTNVRVVATKLRRLNETALERPPRALRINPDLTPSEIRSTEVVRLDHVSDVRGGRLVLRDVSFTLDARARVVIVGENGAGKSTLLDLIAGVRAPDTGSVLVAGAARIGYLDQHANWLQADGTLLDAYLSGRSGSQQELTDELYHFGFFRHDEVQTKVSNLSLGQRRKAQLARLIGQRANVLLLDEPTNHLSLDLVESLEEALHDFDGAILAVSHDRWFVEKFGGEVWRLEDGQLSSL